MSNASLIRWEPHQGVIVPNTVVSARELAPYAKQLRPRDQSQIIAAMEASHFEMASTFVWSKAIAALKKQLATLGSEFIGEMLQRPDIDAYADISSVVTESEAISLAESLGMVTSTDALRLRHTHELINHFAAAENLDEEDPSFGMTPEDAVGCLRTCIQSVLGHPKLEVAETFARFRRELEETSFTSEHDAILSLQNSPYFYQKTTLSVLLALLKTAQGAQLQHVANNIVIILPLIWQILRKPERWQAGQSYAELYSAGKKPAFLALKKALQAVHGFDYVPESLRSNTFTRAAHDLLRTHEGMNNFYNEPGPMRVLASLGTTIPGPAFPACMTATLAVWLGNEYGHCWEAAEIADSVLNGTSDERWTYYLDGCLPSDRTILYKLTLSKPVSRWIPLMRERLDKVGQVANREVARLLEKTSKKDSAGVMRAARQLYHAANGGDAE